MKLQYGLLILILKIILTSTLFTKDLNGNEYLTQYDKINYDINDLNHKHLRVKRSIDQNIYFNFQTYNNQNFHIKLHTALKNSFDTQKKIEIHNKNEKGNHLNELVTFYEGILLDEPNDSFVSGTIIGGVFYGTIESDTKGKYYIEASRRYNHTLSDAHSIIYHENDVNLNKVPEKRSIIDDKEWTLSCGSSKKNVDKKLKDEQKKLYTERLNTKGFDPYSYIDPDKYLYQNNYEHEFNKYSREAQEDHLTKQKRSIQTKDKYKKKFIAKEQGIKGPKRVNFPNQRTMCDLYLRVDPQLYTEIYNNEGNKDHVKTVSFILFYLNKHVEALNTVYNGLKFYNSDKTKYYVGVQFMIYRTKIITEEQCRTKSNLTTEELKLCVPFLDVSAFLNFVSLDNFDDYCLSYTFTARDFTDGTLGLAWVAKLTGSVGGVCERRQSLQGISKSLNSGIVTVVNYKSRVPEAVSQITFAHEVGHNFGSEHDPDDSLCSPGMTKGGNYIMYRRATTGTDRNNRNFSECSSDQMGPIIHSLVQNPIKFCFKQYNGSLCGNGIVEPGEECDCGYANECKEKSCCYDADKKPSEKCRLKPNAKCSPSQGPCCDGTCEYVSENTVCMIKNECLNNVTCTGKNSFCPRNSSVFFKPGLTPCNSGTQVCRSGECVGSICEAHDMVQCYLQGNLKDKKQDKSILCHLACIGEKTGNICMDSFQINNMVTPGNVSGLILKPGSPCIGTEGYCDIFSKCRPVDGEGPLSRLKNLLLNPVTLSAIREWVTRYWWAVMLMTVGVLVFMVAFIKVCSVHTPSSNPRKTPALKITDTLRRPIKHIPHPHLNLHRHTPSAPPAPARAASSSAAAGHSKPSASSKHQTSTNQVVNERYSKNKKITAKSSRNGSSSNHNTDNKDVSSKIQGNIQSNRQSSRGADRDRSSSHKGYRSNSQSQHPPSSHSQSAKYHSSSNNPNHITDKSQRTSRLGNMFTLKKSRHKNMDPNAQPMQNMQPKSSNNGNQRSKSTHGDHASGKSYNVSNKSNGISSSNQINRSKSSDPISSKKDKGYSSKSNKNIENLPPLPDMIIKNVKRSTKNSKS